MAALALLMNAVNSVVDDSVMPGKAVVFQSGVSVLAVYLEFALLVVRYWVATFPDEGLV